MASSKVSALPAVPAASGADQFLINESGTSKEVTLNQIATFRNRSPSFTGTPVAPTAAIDANTTQLATTAFVQSDGPTKVLSLANDATANGLTTAVRVSGMNMVVGPGTYNFEYYIRTNIADVGNSMKFAVNHTNTTTSFCYNFYFTNVGVTILAGAISQAVNATTGQITGFQSTRTKNTLLGPEQSVDAATDILFRISGFMVVSLSGTLELYQGSEVAGNLITIKAGTSLILTKVS